MGLKPRIFMHGDKRLPDPDPSMTPQAVREHYAGQYPELTTATHAFSLGKDGKPDTYTFKKSAGTKG